MGHRSAPAFAPRRNGLARRGITNYQLGLLIQIRNGIEPPQSRFLTGARAYLASINLVKQNEDNGCWELTPYGKMIVEEKYSAAATRPL